MKSIGKVISISNGKLVVKARDPIKIGSKVFDEAGNFVGNLHEYFGPTGRPYLLISPKKKPDQYMGKELFV